MPTKGRTARSSESIRHVLERTLSESGLSRKLERRLPRQVWREAVGDGIADRATPTVLSGGVLHLLVEDHRWRDQLDAARTMLIARINARLGRPLVRELRFGLAHAGAFAPSARERRAAPQVAGTAIARAPAAAGLHPELRAAFDAAAQAASNARARTG